MESFEAARAVYEEIAVANERSAEALAVELQEHARLIRDGNIAEVRTEVATILEFVGGDEMERVADGISQSAQDIRHIFASSSATFEELPDDTAGLARLGTDDITVDPTKIEAQDGAQIIDVTVAADVLAHEEEHTKQSPTADAEEIHVGSRTFDARKLRERAAIEQQERTDFLSDEYQQIHRALSMDEQDVLLVREGRFQELERRLNGRERATAA